MAIFITIVSIVVCVLNIVLFFKVWGMCNNVKRIAEYFCVDEYSKSTIDIDNGANARKAMVAELKVIAKKARGIYAEDYENKYGVNPNKEISDIIKKYKKIYESLGEQFPKDIDNIKTLDDFWEKFD